MIIAKLIFSFFLLATEEPQRVPTEEDLRPNTDYMILLGVQRDKCSNESQTTDCDRVLIYEKNREEIHHLLLDGREFKSKFTLNDALRDPSSFDGPMETFQLLSEFKDVINIDSVSAKFKKDGLLEIKLSGLDKFGEKQDLEKNVSIKRLLRLEENK